MPEPVNRIRSMKLHVWVNPKLMSQFENLRIRLGYSRDGALERAMSEYITAHKKDADATTPHSN